MHSTISSLRLVILIVSVLQLPNLSLLAQSPFDNGQGGAAPVLPQDQSFTGFDQAVQGIATATNSNNTQMDHSAFLEQAKKNCELLSKLNQKLNTNVTLRCSGSLVAKPQATSFEQKIGTVENYLAQNIAALSTDETVQNGLKQDAQNLVAGLRRVHSLNEFISQQETRMFLSEERLEELNEARESLTTTRLRVFELKARLESVLKPIALAAELQSTVDTDFETQIQKAIAGLEVSQQVEWQQKLNEWSLLNKEEFTETLGEMELQLRRLLAEQQYKKVDNNVEITKYKTTIQKIKQRDMLLEQLKELVARPPVADLQSTPDHLKFTPSHKVKMVTDLFVLNESGKLEATKSILGPETELMQIYNTTQKGYTKFMLRSGEVGFVPNAVVSAAAN